MKEKEEEEKRENQKVADLLFNLDSRLLGMELLGRFDMERIVTILDMTKFESDQKEKIALWFGQSTWYQPFTGSNVSWHNLRRCEKTKHSKPHLSTQLTSSGIQLSVDLKRNSQHRHRSALQKLGIIPWKDWDDDIYEP